MSRLVGWLQLGEGRARWMCRGPAEGPAQAGMLVRHGCSAKTGKPQALASLVSAAITKTVIGDGCRCTCGSDARDEETTFHSERVSLYNAMSGAGLQRMQLQLPFFQEGNKQNKGNLAV